MFHVVTYADDRWTSEGLGDPDAGTCDTLAEAIVAIGDLRASETPDMRWGPLAVRDADGTIAWREDAEPDRRTFRIEEIPLDALHSTDLRAEAAGEGSERNLASPFDGAYRILIDGAPEAAEALVATFPDASIGRIGIAWGADAQWGDVRDLFGVESGDGFLDIRQAVDDFLNDAEAWEARA